MSYKKKGELPSGNIRKRVYDHSELIFDEKGITVIDEKTGKQKKKRIYISITAANQKLAQIEAGKIKSGKKPISNRNMTLREAVRSYIETSRSVLSPSTIAGYEVNTKYGFQDIMDTKLSDIDNILLKEAVGREINRPKESQPSKTISVKTLINEYGLIEAAIHFYAKEINTSVKLPQKKVKFRDLPSPEDIFNAVKGTNVELPVMLAMWLSFTMSEVRGLTKSNSISTDGNFILIKGVKLTVNGKHIYREQAKNPKRNRAQLIPEYIKSLIDKVDGDVLVPETEKTVLSRFSKAIDKKGIKHITFHDLRHVNASLMVVLKIPDKYAQDRGGWKSEHILKSVYQETFSAERKAVDTKVDNYFNENVIGSNEFYVSEKYKNWLSLFGKEDSKENRINFEKFCKDNNL